MNKLGEVGRDQWAALSLRAFTDSFNLSSSVLYLRLSVLCQLLKAQHSAARGYCWVFQGMICVSIKPKCLVFQAGMWN